MSEPSTPSAAPNTAGIGLLQWTDLQTCSSRRGRASAPMPIAALGG